MSLAPLVLESGHSLIRDRQPHSHHHLLAVAQREHELVAALVHAFSEFTFGFNRLTGVWPALPEDSGNLSQCDEREHAIGMFFSNNFGHQVFHAVSAWGALHGRYQAAAKKQCLGI